MALGLIEGIADDAAGVAKLAGGALADDPQRRTKVAVGGYVTTAVLSSGIGLAMAPWQVFVLRTGAWAARGVRGPSRNAILADVVPPDAYGRAYGFERTADNLGAIVGPVLAIALIAIFDVRTAMLVSIVPGLLAALAILAAVRRVRRASAWERRPIHLQVRPVLRGGLGRLFAGMGAFEFGNCAATLLILRATELLEPGRGQDRAASIAVLLYVAYNVAATLASLPATSVIATAPDSCCWAEQCRSSPPSWCSRVQEPAWRCSGRGSCSRASASEPPRPRNTRPSRSGRPS